MPERYVLHGKTNAQGNVDLTPKTLYDANKNFEILSLEVFGNINFAKEVDKKVKAVMSRVANNEGDIALLDMAADEILISVESKASQASVDIIAGEVSLKASTEYVNTAISEVNQLGLNLVSNLSVNWEQGAIWPVTGGNEPSTNGIRTIGYYPVVSGDVVVKCTNTAFQVMPLYYDIDHVYIGYSAYGSEVQVSNATMKYMRFIVRRADLADITPDVISDVLLKLEQGTTPTTWSAYPKDLGVDLTDITSRLDEAELKITPEAITNIVETTTNLLAKKAELETTADGLNLAISNIQIGGRNLLKGSSNIERTMTVGSYATSVSGMKTLEELDLKVGDTVTFRIRLRVPYSIGAVARITYYYADDSYDAVVGNLILPYSEGYSMVQLVIPSGVTKLDFVVRNQYPGGIETAIYYNEEKAEKGTKPTAWTPAIDELKGINYNFSADGFEIKDSNGAVMLTPNGFPQEQNFGRADNVESGFPLRLPFRIGANVSSITQVLLEWTNYPFRTYSKGAANGGSSAPTSGASSNSTSGASSVSSSGALSSGWSTVDTNYALPTGSDHYHRHLIEKSALAHVHNIQHNHNMAHTHIIAIDPHTHLPIYGILETPVTSNVIDVWVDGIFRMGTNAPEGILDITAWVTTPGKHTIDLVNPIGMKRIDANVFMKSYNRR